MVIACSIEYMNLTDDEVLKMQKGNTPIFLDDICALYSPTIGEIVDIGYSKFQQYVSILTAEKPISQKTDDAELQKLLESLTDFQYIIMMVMTDREANQIFKEGFRFFTHEDQISFLTSPEQIIIGPLEQSNFMGEREFYDFQRLLKRMCFIEQDGEEIIIYDDDNPAVRKLKMQRKANREKLRRAKAKKARQEGTDLKFSDLIGSLCFGECGLNGNNIYNITYYMFYDQLKRSGWHEQFEINNRAAMAGAKLNKSQLKHWMRSIASSDKS